MKSIPLDLDLVHHLSTNKTIRKKCYKSEMTLIW